MEFLSKGGYAEVFYDRSRRDIYRRMPRRNQEQKQLDVSSFTDLVFTRTFEHTGCTPVIYGEQISKDFVSYRMPHYGISLHKWVRQENMNTRKRYAPYILLQIVLACIHFEKNGFFHSDIKPLNIMIETVYGNRNEDEGAAGSTKPEQDNGSSDDSNSHANSHANSDDYDQYYDIEDMGGSRSPRDSIQQLKVRVIDFNCSSIKTIDHKNQAREWSYGIGTWHYMPPEIILQEMPYDNSASWTIGVLAAYIIDAYPFADIIKNRTEKALLEQETWKELLNECAAANHEHIFLSRNRFYSDPWHELIYHCTHWRSANRWSLHSIYKYLYENLMNHNSHHASYIVAPSLLADISPIEHMIEIANSAILPKEQRTSVINKMYTMCENMDKMTLFPTAVAIFDRALGEIGMDFVGKTWQLAAGSYLLSCFMNSVSILSSRTYMSRLLNTFSCINRTQALAALCYIGQLLSWKLWEKPSHIIVVEADASLRWDRSLFEHIRVVLVDAQGSYTQQRIAQEVLRRIRTPTATVTVLLPDHPPEVMPIMRRQTTGEYRQHGW